MSPWTYYWISVVILTGLLFIPVTRLIWVMAVRRLERKLGQPLSDVERAGQRNRARLIALVLAAIFSALFNFSILNMGHQP